MHFTCAARTDVGVVRSGNEDNYLMLSDRGVFIVADGMGGHAAGEVASEMAVRITSREIGSIRGLSEPQVGERIRAAIRVANDAIFERTISEHDKRGMGTTLTAGALVVGFTDCTSPGYCRSKRCTSCGTSSVSAVPVIAVPSSHLTFICTRRNRGASSALRTLTRPSVNVQRPTNCPNSCSSSAPRLTINAYPINLKII